MRFVVTADVIAGLISIAPDFFLGLISCMYRFGSLGKMLKWWIIRIITRRKIMSHMFNPPHPGEVLKDGVMVEGVTVTGLAKQLGVTRVALSRVLNAHAGISADMAIKLALVFGGSAESWLYMQANYDLWQAERRAVQHKKRVHVAA